MIRAAGFIIGFAAYWAGGLASAEQQRWYSPADAAEGKSIFLEHCAGCHGERAQGLTSDWKKRQADGSFPPPPLDGTAHAWHHPLALLVKTINDGGAVYGGKMPAFGNQLSDADKRAVIAYFQSFWSDEIYNHWIQINARAQ